METRNYYVKELLAKSPYYRGKLDAYTKVLKMLKKFKNDDNFDISEYVKEFKDIEGIEYEFIDILMELENIFNNKHTIH